MLGVPLERGGTVWTSETGKGGISPNLTSRITFLHLTFLKVSLTYGFILITRMQLNCFWKLTTSIQLMRSINREGYFNHKDIMLLLLKWLFSLMNRVNCAMNWGTIFLQNILLWFQWHKVTTNNGTFVFSWVTYSKTRTSSLP